jgi:translation initiation factor 1 (eIF-1/SUI1)
MDDDTGFDLEAVARRLQQEFSVAGQPLPNRMKSLLAELKKKCAAPTSN